MSETLAAEINSFGPMPGAEAVPTSEPIFVLTSSQLQEIIFRAIQPLKDEIAALREERDKDREEMAAMKAKMASLEELIEDKRQENIQEFDGIYISLGKHRDRLDQLESPHKGSGETETARAEKIEKYLLSQPGRRASYESLRGLLGVDKDLLNDAIKALMAASPGRYGIVGVPGDKRKRALIMLPK